MNILEYRNISKTFSGVKALSNVSLEVKKGEVHAILGENGAGKSTLVKILAGVYKPDPGNSELIIDGESIQHFTPIYARQKGVSIMYQEIDLIPNLTVAQNIILGLERKKMKIFLDNAKSLEDIKNLLARLNINLPLHKKVKDLSIAHQQMAMIAKAIFYNSKILVMDEPTSPLVNKDIENLFRIIKNLKQKGVTILYITHRLEEVFQIADRFTVFKDGEKVTTSELEGVTKDDLIWYMIGRKIKTDDHKISKINKRVKILEVINISTGNKVNNVSFELFEGEILGISGLVGSGRTELARAILGLDRLTKGKVIICGKECKNVIENAIKFKIGYVPEDRKNQGLLLNMKVMENVSIVTLKNLFSKGYFIKKKDEEKAVKKILNRLEVKPPDYSLLVKNLSGGNQQKVILAKWLLADTKIIIIDEPTRGIDVGAKEEIYKLMYDLKAAGNSIIMISSELPEVIRVSDRTIVMSKGTVKAELSKDDINEKTIMDYAIQ